MVDVRRLRPSCLRRQLCFVCGVFTLVVYWILWLRAGFISDPENIDFDLPYRFPVAQSWAWEDDIAYRFEGELENSDGPRITNNNNSIGSGLPEEISQSLAQDREVRSVELEGVADYIMWRDRSTDWPTHSVIRKIKHCTKPIKNIVFLKTHFTGSDVITNVFNRFADLRNLRVALPADGLSTFHWPSRFQWKFLDMMTMGGLLPNILCNHARFNADVMDAIMDRQTAFVTIVRNPSTLFESTFRNLDFAAVLGMEGLADPFSSFLDSPGVHIRRAVREKRFRDSLNLIKNSMLFDLGLRPADYHKPDLVRDTVREIDAKFTLVLVYEHLDESLVLLKRKLCWQLDDILHLKFLYLDKEKFARRNITEEQKRQVRTWNAADVMLYEYFNKTLWKSIGDGGNSFRQDLTEFRGIQTAIEKDCLGNVTIDSGNKFVVNPDVSPFNRYLCEKLMTDELQYLNYFRKKLENEKRGGNFEDATFKMSPQNTSAATDDLIK